MKHPTIKELQLAGRLLELAADEFSNHGCNEDWVLMRFLAKKLQYFSE